MKINVGKIVGALKKAFSFWKKGHEAGLWEHDQGVQYGAPVRLFSADGKTHRLVPGDEVPYRMKLGNQDVEFDPSTRSWRKASK